MRMIKVFLTLIFAVVLGFIIHNNWNWLTRAEPIVVFTYSYDKAPAKTETALMDSGSVDNKTMEYRLQTVPLPMWIYMFGSLVFGAVFVLFGAMRDVFISRRERKRAVAELNEYKMRYDEPSSPPSAPDLPAPKNAKPYAFDDQD